MWRSPLTVEPANGQIRVGDVVVNPGRKAKIELPFARMATGTEGTLPVAVINGRDSGPNVWLSAAIHGDELNGIEIVRLVLGQLDAASLRGAVIAAPIVNPLGFLNGSRYLPDRRDLNRSFPGSRRGSTAARLAHLFMTEVVEQCSIGIDLHTATNHRTNIPQIRGDMDDPATLKLSKAFGAPYSIHAKQRRGSLRQAAANLGATVLVYEAGEANRFNHRAIRTGVGGVMRTLQSLEMIKMSLPDPRPTKVMRRTRWVRARRGGLAEINVKLGDFVGKGEIVVSISDAFGAKPTSVKAVEPGWVIARTLHPLVNPGDALVHVAIESGPDQDEPAERAL